MKTLNDFFSNIYCINLDSRPDKYELCLDEFKKINIKVERISGIDGKKIFETGMNRNAGCYGLLQTKIKIYHDAQQKKYDNILILEDDVEFINNFNKLFFSKIEFLPNDWDMLYIGGNNIFQKGEYTPITGNINFKINKNNYKNLNYELVKTTWTQTTHAIGINKKFINPLLSYIQDNPKVPNDLGHPHLQQKGYNAYVFMPSLALQRPSFSDIENQFIDYNKDPRWSF